MFLAEDSGEALSGLLAVPFGDSVVMKRFGWSGGKRQLRPNDLLIWRAIEWSKENGFQNFDLDGIHISAARALLAGQSLPESEKSTTTRFKLGFGGSIILLPAGCEYISNDILRMVFSKFVMMLGRDNMTQMIRRIPPARMMRKAG